MQTPTRTDPPYVPIRSTAWPVRKTPRWLLAAGLHRGRGACWSASRCTRRKSQRAADLNGFLTDMKTDIQSCAGGVRDSLTALRSIEAGTASTTSAPRSASPPTGRRTAPRRTTCSSMTWSGTRCHESLASFRLDRVVYGLVDWATPDALRVQADVGRRPARAGRGRAPPPAAS